MVTGGKSWPTTLLTGDVSKKMDKRSFSCILLDKNKAKMIVNRDKIFDKNIPNSFL